MKSYDLILALPSTFPRLLPSDKTYNQIILFQQVLLEERDACESDGPCALDFVTRVVLSGACITKYWLHQCATHHSHSPFGRLE